VEIFYATQDVGQPLTIIVVDCKYGKELTEKLKLAKCDEKSR